MPYKANGPAWTEGRGPCAVINRMTQLGMPVSFRVA